MKKKLNQVSKYFTVQEDEAKAIINEIKETTTGEVVKEQIDKKEHKDYGPYFEITVKEEFTTSKNVLELGY